MYSTEAITTVKTISYTTPAGGFCFHSIKPACFFDYTVAHFGHVPVLIAEPEKAIIDFLYLNSLLKRSGDFTALRFNTDVIAEKIDWTKLSQYAGLFESATLSKRIRLFKKINCMLPLSEIAKQYPIVIYCATFH